MEFIINGQARKLDGLHEGSTVADLVQALALAEGRVALEQNGEIVPRDGWAQKPVAAGDRLEIVHFVGGGSSSYRQQH